MRIAMIIVLCSCVAASVGAVANNASLGPARPVNFSPNEPARPDIDPIITGTRVSADQLVRWQAARGRYDACGLCGEGQAYPGDLPQ